MNVNHYLNLSDNDFKVLVPEQEADLSILSEKLKHITSLNLMNNPRLDIQQTTV